MCMASMAAGADGLMIEVHINPDAALSDAATDNNSEQLYDIYQHLSSGNNYEQVI